jgi:ketosteroid isomerase-like protein
MIVESEAGLAVDWTAGFLPVSSKLEKVMRVVLLLMFCSLVCAEDARAQGNPRDFQRAGPVMERAMYFAQVRREVHEMLLAWQDAWSRDDAKKITTFYTDDANVFPVAGPQMQTHGEVAGYYAKFLATVGAPHLQMVDFGISGEIAYVTARISYFVNDEGGKLRPVTRTDMLIMRRRFSGGWQIQSQLMREDPEEKQNPEVPAGV